MIYPRHLKTELLAAAADTPVILLNGARQTGKSTLLSTLALSGTTTLVSLDDLTTLASIRQNAQAYLSGLSARHIILDEVQRAPEIFLPLKESVDRRREPGRYFLTGSANVLALPKLADTLAGRMQIIHLWPLSQGELIKKKEQFIDYVFSATPFPNLEGCSLAELVEKVIVGGYPEAILRHDLKRREAWFQSYIQTILQRDVQDLSRIEGLTALPNLLSLIATRTGGLLNVADLSRGLGLSNPTLQRYLKLLEAVFLLVTIPPWFSNLGKRFFKASKLYLNDTGILCYLLGTRAEMLLHNHNQLGPILENFVIMELIKQIGWSDKKVSLSHYRTHAGQEVDVILAAGLQIVGIEIKTASALTAQHYKGLRHLRAELGEERFHRGIVLYTGRKAIAIDDKLWALPMSFLWDW